MLCTLFIKSKATAFHCSSESDDTHTFLHLLSTITQNSGQIIFTTSNVELIKYPPVTEA